MAKNSKKNIKKRKKRKICLERFASVLLVFSVSLFIFNALFITQAKNKIAMDIQKVERETETLAEENRKLTLEITALSAKDRVTTIAAENGLSLNMDNVISLGG